MLFRRWVWREILTEVRQRQGAGPEVPWWQLLTSFWQATKDESRDDYNHGYLPFSEFQTFAVWMRHRHPEGFAWRVDSD